MTAAAGPPPGPPVPPPDPPPGPPVSPPDRALGSPGQPVSPPDRAPGSPGSPLDRAPGPAPVAVPELATLGRRGLHERWMRRALSVALPAAAGLSPADPGADVPVGAVLYDPSGTELAAARNERELTADPTAHAEILVLRRAAATVGTSRLDGCTLVVTLEPCTMCAGAVVLARVATVVFGAWEPKTGAVGSLWDVVRDRRLNHRPEVYAGVLEQECAALLRGFFRPPADA